MSGGSGTRCGACGGRIRPGPVGNAAGAVGGGVSGAASPNPGLQRGGVKGSDQRGARPACEGLHGAVGQRQALLHAPFPMISPHREESNSSSESDNTELPSVV